MKLSEQKCSACLGGTPPLSGEKAAELAREISRWTLGDKSIEREFRFEDFRASINFVNEVAELAEAEDHHPDIHIFYNKVRIELSTHKIGGLSNNDFVLAAKIDRLIN